MRPTLSDTILATILSGSKVYLKQDQVQNYMKLHVIYEYNISGERKERKSKEFHNLSQKAVDKVN